MVSGYPDTAESVTKPDLEACREYWPAAKPENRYSPPAPLDASASMGPG
jgi:hypothetical protein